MNESDMQELWHKSKAAYDALSPLEKAIADDDQRRSYVYGQTGQWPPMNPFRVEMERLREQLREQALPASMIPVTRMTLMNAACCIELYHMIPEEKKRDVLRHLESLYTGGKDSPISAGEIAERLHEAYELLAPTFGYETRSDTKVFDPTTPNGRLMIAVVHLVIMPLLKKETP